MRKKLKDVNIEICLRAQVPVDVGFDMIDNINVITSRRVDMWLAGEMTEAKPFGITPISLYSIDTKWADEEETKRP
jgi:hypothetical protein